jgi:hypothetical protein
MEDEAPEEEIEATDEESEEETEEETEEESEEETMMENKKPVKEVLTMGTALLMAAGIISGLVGGGAIVASAEKKRDIKKKTAELLANGMPPEEAAKEAIKFVNADWDKPAYGPQTGKGGFNPGTNLEEEKEKINEAALSPVEIAGIIGGITSIVGGSVALSTFQDKALAGKYGENMKRFMEKLTAAGSAAAGATQHTSTDSSRIQAGDSDEVTETIETLKAELNEVNLLNSKLLYTNKIFKAKNLTEAQKVKVLTTFDKAESVKEVKLVYETLLEGLVSTTATTKEAIKESKSFASKAVGVSPKKPVVETDGMVSRFQKLAGIK